MHEVNYEPGYFSNEFKEFASLLLLADPSKRPNHEQILQHPWMQIKSQGKDEIKDYFDQMLSSNQSCTTASSSGESKAREMINSYMERRGSPVDDDDEESTALK